MKKWFVECKINYSFNICRCTGNGVLHRPTERSIKNASRATISSTVKCFHEAALSETPHGYLDCRPPFLWVGLHSVYSDN